MIARLIAWSARNLLLVLFGAVFAAAAGVYALRSPSALDAIPDLSDTQVIVYTEYPGPGTAGDRGPGHLSADDGDAHRAEIEGGARLLVLRRLVRLRHLRGRHRHLLGAVARPGIPQRRGVQASRRRHADHRARRDRRRLGLPIRRAVQGIEPGGHAIDPGLDIDASRCPRPKASPRSPASAASSSSTTSSSTRSGCATAASACRKCARRSAPATSTSAAAPSSSRSSNSSSAARATSRASTISATSC